ncbi:hypothetical protein FOA52_005261 [Chlamydomonas sp. UWO 241]|nr:hypothetical protein FOA52_005261 [Chlamydomonas sp. UWO 241]
MTRSKARKHSAAAGALIARAATTTESPAQAHQIASLVDVVSLLVSRVPGAPMQMPHAEPARARAGHAAHSAAPRAAPAAEAAQPARPAAAAAPVASAGGGPATERPASGATRAASARGPSRRGGLPARVGDSSLRRSFVLSIPVARGANWLLAGGGRRMDEEEATAAAAERIAAAAEDGTSLPVRLATDVVRFLYGGTGRREPADGGVVSASLLNAKPAVGGIGVEPRGGGVLRVLFTVASDAVADTVVRWRHELRRCVDSTAVFDVLSDREEAQHQALWPAFLAAKVAGKRAQFHRARLVVDGERRGSSMVSRAGLGELVYEEGYIEVDEVLGSRIVMDGETPRMEYLVKWKASMLPLDTKEETDMSWEAAINLSEDVIRDYDNKWWAAASKAELEPMAKMLAGGRQALATIVDENGRSALHFAAARGSLDCVKMLVEAGSDPVLKDNLCNMQDKEGYTPLHMAAGYMHTATMAALLEAGADPVLKDNTGRDVVGLIGNLRGQMPLSPMTIQRRIALEQVASVLTDRVYEDVEPSKILNARKRGDGQRELLVSFADGRDDEWINEADVAADIIEDWDAGIEYATARAVVDVVQVGTERRFKVEWEDDYPTSWEAEEHLPPDLITLFQHQNPGLFQQRVDAAAGSSGGGGAEWRGDDADWEAAAVAADGQAGSGDSGAAQHSDGYRTQYSKVHVGAGSS